VDYELKAEAGKYVIISTDPGTRIQECEKEIMKILDKYNCILAVQVMAKKE
jgi:hypothetical protein